MEFAENHTKIFFTCQRGISEARKLLAPRRDPNETPVIQIFWGASGTGKTRKAIEENKDAYILTKARDGKDVWWQGYTGQKVVIIDEFYGWIKYDFLLRMLDRYPLEVEFKGGSVQLAATKFIFTSNKPWQDWYKNIDDLSALRRRIDEWGTVTEFEKVENIVHVNE